MLLYQDKGLPTDIAIYRLIGLACSIYKLYTSLITTVLAEFAKGHGLLSLAQHVLRQGRGTMEAVQALVMAYEDAMQAQQDIYAMYM